MKIAGLTLVLLISAFGCEATGETDAFLNSQVPVAHLDSILEEADSVELPIADTRKLIGFTMMQAFGEAPPRDTMSIRQIIAWVDSAEVRQAAREAEAEKLALEERARLARVRAQADSVLTVALVNKGFLPSSYEANRYEDYVTLDFVFNNKAEEDILGFQGTVYLMDMFGDTIFSAGLKVDDPVRAGSRLRQQRTIDYNQFSDEHRVLRQANLDNTKVVWQPRVVILEGGRRIEVE